MPQLGKLWVATYLAKRRCGVIASQRDSQTCGHTDALTQAIRRQGSCDPRSLDDFSDVIWINSHSGQPRYPF
jgi:hypothetical protein